MGLYAKHNEVGFQVGDTVKVHYRIIEKETKSGETKRSVKEIVKDRIQPFEGLVIGIKGAKENKTFTVRKIGSYSVGVERIFPLNSPWIKKMEVTRKGKVRRAKLNYLRDRKGKAATFVRERKESQNHEITKSRDQENKKIPVAY
jgi:large subunit ribosomal protein L19